MRVLTNDMSRQVVRAATKPCLHALTKKQPTKQPTTTMIGMRYNIGNIEVPIPLKYSTE